MRPTLLPTCPQKDFVDSPPKTRVGIGDDEKHARDSSGDQTGMKALQEGVALAPARLQPQHLPFAGLGDAMVRGRYQTVRI